MFDKQLCKLIHKKEITIADILYEIACRGFNLLIFFTICFVICSLAGAATFDYFNLQFEENVYGILKLSGCGFISIAVSIIIIYIFVMCLGYILDFKIASCPNYKEENKIEFNDEYK